MGRKPFKTADEKLQVVLSVLRGEMTHVKAARRLQMSQTTIAKWQKQFLEGAHESLARGENAQGPRSRRRFNDAVLEAVYIKDRRIGRAEFSEVFAPLFSRPSSNKALKVDPRVPEFTG